MCPSSAANQSCNRPNFDVLDQKFRCELAVDFSGANVISCRHHRQEELLVPRGCESCRGAVGPSRTHGGFVYLYTVPSNVSITVVRWVLDFKSKAIHVYPSTIAAITAAMEKTSHSNNGPRGLEMARTDSRQSRSRCINSKPNSTAGHDPETPPQNNENLNIVDWDGPDDPEHPQNWPDARKWLNVAILF